jgi:hypothetical protein
MANRSWGVIVHCPDRRQASSSAQSMSLADLMTSCGSAVGMRFNVMFPLCSVLSRYCELAIYSQEPIFTVSTEVENGGARQ